MEARGESQVFNADPIQGARLKRLVPLASDMHRFALSHWTMIEKAPLQVYLSALIFSPANSLTRKLFALKEPDWIVQKPRVEQSWNSCLARLVGHHGTVSSVSFSPNGHHVVSGSYDGTIQIWDAETGAETLTLQGHNNRVWSVAFDEDCKFITSKSDDPTIKVWDAETGASISTCKGFRELIYDAIFSPDKRRRTQRFSPKGIIHIMDSGSDTEVLTLRGHSRRVTSVAFSPDGHYIASGSADKTVKIWDAVTGNEISTLQGHALEITSVCFSPDSRHLASGSKDETIRIWDVDSSAETSTPQGHYDHNGNLRSVALSLDGRRVASGTIDRTVQIWDTETGDNLQTFSYNSGIIFVTFSPCGRCFAASTLDETVVVFDAESGATILTRDVSRDTRFDHFALSLSGCHIAIGSGPAVMIQDAENVKGALSLKGHSNKVASLAFSPKDCHILASASSDNTVKIWNLEIGAEISTLSVGTEMSKLRFDFTGAFLYTTSLFSSNSLLPWDSTWSLNSDSSQTDSVLPKIRQNAYGVENDSKGSWITWHGQNILWLPPEFQPSRDNETYRYWDIVSDMISIGCNSGRVWWLKFSPEHQPFCS